MENGTYEIEWPNIRYLELVSRMLIDSTCVESLLITFGCFCPVNELLQLEADRFI